MAELATMALPAAAMKRDSAKEQVMDNVPKRIKEMRFGILYVQSDHV